MTNKPIMTTEPLYQFSKDGPSLNSAFAWPKVKPIEEWQVSQNMMSRLNTIQERSRRKDVPIHKKTDPVPVYPLLEQHLFILPKLLMPLLVHRIWMELFPQITFHPVFALFFYYVSMMTFMHLQSKSLRRMGTKYGYYDGEHPRDIVPEPMKWKLVKGLLATLSSRSVLAVFWVYDRNVKPTITWKTPIDIVMYTLILDLFYYTYHRALHEVPFLWKYHKLHHSVRHPMVHMAAYADEVQEWFDMIIVPVLTYMVLPVNFSTWYLATGYIASAEAAGHSGVRVYWRAPTLGWLRYFGRCELAIEDHDCHHQFGYRHSGDYGKQSRLWDGLFGTKRERIESHDANLDWVNTANTWGK